MKHIMCKLVGGTKDDDLIVKHFLESATHHCLDVRKVATERFREPDGVTSIILLGESHYSIHTFHQNDCYMVDLFTCNPNTPFKKVIRRLATKTKSTIEDIVELDRD